MLELHLVQRRQRLFDIGHHRHIRGNILADFRGINVDMAAPCGFWENALLLPVARSEKRTPTAMIKSERPIAWVDA